MSKHQYVAKLHFFSNLLSTLHLNCSFFSYNQLSRNLQVISLDMFKCASHFQLYHTLSSVKMQICCILLACGMPRYTTNNLTISLTIQYIFHTLIFFVMVLSSNPGSTFYFEQAVPCKLYTP